MFLVVSVNAQTFSIYTEFSVDSSYIDESDNKLKGFSVEIVREIMKKLNINSEIQLVPWARGYNYLENDENTILFATARTPERENKFKWVGPITVVTWEFFAMKNSALKINSLDDAKKLISIGTYKDDAKEVFLKKNGFTNYVTNYGENGDVDNIRKLKLGAIQSIISSRRLLEIACRKFDYDVNDFKKLYTVKKIYVYIAFSSDVDDSIVRNWQTELNKMKKDGSYSRIFQKYPDSKSLMTFDPPGSK